MTSVVQAIAVVGAIAALVAPVRAQAAHKDHQETTTYVARLHALNAKTTGMQSDGVARFTVRGDSLTIDITMHHVPPSMTHLQHFHGFPDGRDATCATAAADTNHDGIIDLRETEPTSGTTMVPFTDDPVSMQIVTDAYPKASAAGSYHYRKTVSLTALESAFAQHYQGQQLDLGKRVVYVHGVPAGKALPATVASLGTIPAQVTLPIACGKIERGAK